MCGNKDDRGLQEELDSVIRAFHLSWNDIQIHQINETLKEPEQSRMRWDYKDARGFNVQPPEPQ